MMLSPSSASNIVMFPLVSPTMLVIEPCTAAARSASVWKSSVMPDSIICFITFCTFFASVLRFPLLVMLFMPPTIFLKAFFFAEFDIPEVLFSLLRVIVQLSRLSNGSVSISASMTAVLMAAIVCVSVTSLVRICSKPETHLIRE